MAAQTGTAKVEVRDLGTLELPILLFGGVYSNLQALEAMLRTRQELNIPVDRTIHTGDVVAYCAQPREAADMLRASGVHCLMGNCEESVGIGKHDCGCGFPEESKCNAYSKNWYAYVMEELRDQPELCAWMASRPRRIEFSAGGRRFAVVHGSPRFISEFVWPSTPMEELSAGFAELPEYVDGLISGHSGIPFVRFVPRAGNRTSGESNGRARLWLNAGVIGVPANDGTQRGWYAIMSAAGGGGINVAIRSMCFDAKKAADAIYAQPRLDRAYGDALIAGLWPSIEILPLEEQMSTEVAIPETDVLWPPDDKKVAEGSAHLTRHSVMATSGLVLAVGILAGAGWYFRIRDARAPPRG